LDNPLRENEGDLILAAQHATPSKLSFMIRHTSGYICAPLSPSRCAALDLPQMVANNKDPHRTAYTVSVDAVAEGVTTGISAHDRAVTARALADPRSVSTDLRRPGHVLPLRAREGGVRERQGHTEAAVDLCRLAGKEQAALICELVTDGEEVEGVPELKGGSMMRRDDCLEFGRRWGIRVCTIEDLRRYIEEKEGRLK
jgi:3,4-dihydroxy 2-butanone 4-phosphate synthase